MKVPKSFCCMHRCVPKVTSGLSPAKPFHCCTQHASALLARYACFTCMSTSSVMCTTILYNYHNCWPTGLPLLAWQQLVCQAWGVHHNTTKAVIVWSCSWKYQLIERLEDQHTEAQGQVACWISSLQTNAEELHNDLYIILVRQCIFPWCAFGKCSICCIQWQ